MSLPPSPTSSTPANAPGVVSAPRPARSGISRGRFAEQNRMAIVTGILCIVLIIGLMQLWLLTATMNAFLGGDYVVVWPALGASTVCLLLNLGLLRYLYLLERPR